MARPVAGQAICENGRGALAVAQVAQRADRGAGAAAQPEREGERSSDAHAPSARRTAAAHRPPPSPQPAAPRPGGDDAEPSGGAAAAPAAAATSPLVFAEARHDVGAGAAAGGAGAAAEGLVARWRQKERLKTTAVALVVCLNIGVDPPDVTKISPCARLECWVDPLSMAAPKALDAVGKNLQAQYERWQPRAKYKMHLDPTTEDVKRVALSCRRAARGERVLFHYNGHGVPRPTANGEIWVFNKSYTQYIPLSLYDLQTWVGTPAIYVFDCSVAGQVLASFKAFMAQRAAEEAAAGGGGGGAIVPTGDPMRDAILLCACGETELLPQSPALPADVFTSCLTTPIKVALRWHCARSLLRAEGVTKELVDRIPGKQTDRKTPLGELNWIFTAITDTIAWNALPRALFQKLFRQDLLVASLFRNFLLAERVLRAAGCAPASHPRLPPTHQHPMWQAWDLAAEMCLLQLPGLLNGADGAGGGGGAGGGELANGAEAPPPREYSPSPFFSEQLTAFELWLEHGSPDKPPPEQLPIVLQVLLSQVHRLRALALLGRFLDMGPWAVDLALSVGIFPYVLKLLQTTAADLRRALVFIWAKIMAWDANAQVRGDLVKDGGHVYFIRHLESADAGVGPESRAQAAFVLAAVCDGHRKGQLLCAQAGLLQACAAQLPAALAAGDEAAAAGDAAGARGLALLVRWLLLCVGKMCEDAPEVAAMALREGVPDRLLSLLGAADAEVRAAATFALGALVQAEAPPAAGGEEDAAAAAAEERARLAAERELASALLEAARDASPLARAEAARALARIALGHALLFQDAVHAHQRTSTRILRAAASSRSDLASARSSPGGSSAAGTAGAAAGASAASGRSGAPPSPGVRLRASFEGGDGGGGGGVFASADAARVGGGVFASADAARVGGGLYAAIVDALVLLAMDPAPLVARAGRAALRAADVEIVAVAAPPSPEPSPRGSAGALGAAVPVPAPPPPAGASGVAALIPKSWQSKSWRAPSASVGAAGGGMSARAAGVQVSSSAASSPGASPAPSVASSAFGAASGGGHQLPAFVLRRLPDAGEPGGAPGGAAAEDAGLVRAAPPLPESAAFRAGSALFRFPLLEPQASEEPGPPWLAPLPADKLAGRARLRREGAERAAALTAGARARLRDDVRTVDVGSDRVAALALDPYKPHVITADGDGAVRVSDFLHAAAVNRFALGDAGAPPGAPPPRVLALRTLNEADRPLLLVGAADGAVRVFRDYAARGEQRLATAFRATPDAAGAAAFALAPDGALARVLFAAERGGRPGTARVRAWDLAAERAAPGAAFQEGEAVVEHLAAGRAAPLLFAGGRDGAVRVFDLRANAPATAVQGARDRLAGLVAEPGGAPHTLVAAHRRGELRFYDTRMLGGGAPGAAALIASVEAHSRGGLTTLAGHARAPLLATATAGQVVKVWRASGEQVGVVRCQTSFLGERIGPIAALSFAPFSLALASGGGDSVCAVFGMDVLAT